MIATKKALGQVPKANEHEDLIIHNEGGIGGLEMCHKPQLQRATHS